MGINSSLKTTAVRFDPKEGCPLWGSFHRQANAQGAVNNLLEGDFSPPNRRLKLTRYICIEGQRGPHA